ncbi:hypothetical protein N7478_008139 [Penicillium angulare]|uniref:uncharacterized protein n=1 Tax=Penicillium angulare TaxID=116970 RepID=UPI00253FB778|nr:uncharacterized protein N7478_008139 [Penicillium angulare]KAJ5273014.1 hypothetical protein N7478_008139 [Penicillium angulare]
MAPRYGALGATFQIARLFQACSLIAIIGMVAKFIAVIVNLDDSPPDILIGTISVTCIAVIYCIISQILYLDDILPFLYTAVLDFLILIGMIVVAVILGKPLSYLGCSALSELGDADAAAYAFASHLGSYISSLSGKLEYKSWIGASKTICLETKAIWGLSIALCILFFISAICNVALWRQKKVMAASDEK